MVVQTRRMGQATRGHAAQLHRQRTQGKAYTLIGIDELREQLKKLVPRHQGEAEVVHTSELGPLLHDWRLRYEKEHPILVSTQTKRMDGEPLGPWEYLTWKTGVHPRRLYSIEKQQVEVVALAQADALLTAMNRVDAYYTGEITVQPNLNWKMERWCYYMSQALEVTP